MTEVIHSGRVAVGVRRRWWLILLLILVGAGAGYWGSSMMQPVYQATTSVLVGQSLQAPDVNNEDIETSQQLAETYADIVQRQPVLAGVVDTLGLESSWQALGNRVRVDLAPDNGQLIVIRVEADSPDEAEAIAGAIADQLVLVSPSAAERRSTAEIQDFVRSRLANLKGNVRRAQKQIQTLESALAKARAEGRKEALRGEIEANQRLTIAWLQNYSSLLEFLVTEESPNSLRVLERASSGDEPIRPDVPFNTVVGAAVGLVLGLMITYVLESRARSRWIGWVEPTTPSPRDGPETAVGWSGHHPLLVLPEDDLGSDIPRRRVRVVADRFAYPQATGRHRRRRAG